MVYFKWLTDGEKFFFMYVLSYVHIHIYAWPLILNNFSLKTLSPNLLCFF